MYCPSVDAAAESVEAPGSATARTFASVMKRLDSYHLRRRRRDVGEEQSLTAISSSGLSFYIAAARGAHLDPQGVGAADARTEPIHDAERCRLRVEVTSASGLTNEHAA